MRRWVGTRRTGPVTWSLFFDWRTWGLGLLTGAPKGYHFVIHVDIGPATVFIYWLDM